MLYLFLVIVSGIHIMASKKSPKKILAFETTDPVAKGELGDEDVQERKARLFMNMPEPTKDDLKDSKILNMTATIGPTKFEAMTGTPEADAKIISLSNTKIDEMHSLFTFTNSIPRFCVSWSVVYGASKWIGNNKTY
ncbi:hypothetical protein Ocin01_02132 [Orchesella cincta]|uniref:Uncharacterized protein n=1 Tax=Orchesella cincta TaxID=48709 RepID=A0A1D2NH09_ORCCI|nr:hypothetical protein Ocin01_02132 [Orchesella cincta]